MQKDFILPDIGEGIVECELVEWLVTEGETIAEDQPVAEVMTDKAVVQIPAMYSGVVKQLYYQKGEIAKVHQPLFAMTVAQESNDNNTADVDVETNAVSATSANVADNAETRTSESVASRVEEDFILPDIGEGIVECELVKWHIQEGDSVEEDQAVAEVMTDKAMVEIPAKHTGVITKLYYQQGDIAKVHSPLYRVAIAGAENVNSTNALSSSEIGAAKSTEVAESPSLSKVSDTSDALKHRQGKAIASPAVRRRAREMDIDISLVSGSGKKGRVLKDDLLRYQSESAVAETQSTSPTTAVTSSLPANAVSGGTRTEAIRGIKAAMAKQMKESVYTIPHFSVSDEVVMDALIQTRKQLKPEFEKLGVKLTFMPFFIKALSLALKQFPIINTQVNDDCTEITYFDDHNIGMAVDSKLGLLVPNIKAVQNLSLLEVAKECNRLVDQAREGKLNKNDLRGGTISISNIGVLGGTVAVPVINKPESAIVALGKMQKLPRFDEEDNVQAVNIMNISWSGDHRTIDGATMVKFSNLWISYLQNPMTMLTELR